MPEKIVRHPLTASLSADEIEAALRTLAELYDNAGEAPGEYLSTYQLQLAARVAKSVDGDDDDDAAPRLIELNDGGLVKPPHPDEPTPHVFLDLSTGVLTEGEMNAITEAPPRVIVHEYGAWVHVPPDEHDEDPLDPAGEGWEDFPILNAVLRAARDRGAWWVNLDRDGSDVIPGLPTFVW